jgi:hypothetical protein
MTAPPGKPADLPGPEVGTRATLATLRENRAGEPGHFAGRRESEMARLAAIPADIWAIGERNAATAPPLSELSPESRARLAALLAVAPPAARHVPVRAAS